MAETMTRKTNKAEGVEVELSLIEWQNAYQAYTIAHPDASVEECERAATETPWHGTMSPELEASTKAHWERKRAEAAKVGQPLLDFLGHDRSSRSPES
jgi:hypothetical protein